MVVLSLRLLSVLFLAPGDSPREIIALPLLRRPRIACINCTDSAVSRMPSRCSPGEHGGVLLFFVLVVVIKKITYYIFLRLRILIVQSGV